MTRPRRSLQVRSSRPRANANTSQRFNGRPGIYRAVGRTLWTPAVVEMHHTGHLVRLQRAEAAHEQARADLDEAECADAAVWSNATTHDDCTVANVTTHLRTSLARLDASEREGLAAQRSASRPIGELVTPPLVSLPQPRTWPNAAPGGTSPRRATRALLRLADSEQVDIVRVPGDPTAYTAHTVAIGRRSGMTHAASAQFVREQVLSFGRAVIVGEA